MKRTIILSMLVIAMALNMAGQVRLGVRGGVTLNKMHFDRDVINSDNRVGYTAGLVLDLNIPVVGLGVEASAMYTHRDNRLSDGNRLFKRHYIDIPVLARYRLALPGVERIVAPYIFTGPCFSVLFDENGGDYYDGNKTYMSWDVGGGVDLMSHIRLSATYGIGMSRAMRVIDREYTGNNINGKDKHWTLSVAWMF